MCTHMHSCVCMYIYMHIHLYTVRRISCISVFSEAFKILEVHPDVFYVSSSFPVCSVSLWRCCGVTQWPPGCSSSCNHSSLSHFLFLFLYKKRSSADRQTPPEGTCKYLQPTVAAFGSLCFDWLSVAPPPSPSSQSHYGHAHLIYPSNPTSPTLMWLRPLRIKDASAYVKNTSAGVWNTLATLALLALCWGINIYRVFSKPLIVSA